MEKDQISKCDAESEFQVNPGEDNGQPKTNSSGDSSIHETSTEDILDGQRLFLSSSTDESQKDESELEELAPAVGLSSDNTIDDPQSQAVDTMLSINNGAAVAVPSSTEQMGVEIKPTETESNKLVDPDRDDEILVRLRSALADAESDEETCSARVSTLPPKPVNEDVNLNTTQKSKKRVMTLIDSESEEEYQSINVAEVSKNIASTLANSDDYKENENNDNIKITFGEAKQSKAILSSLVDSDSDTDTSNDEKQAELKNLSSAESTSETEQSVDQKSSKIKAKKMRASAKNALDNIQVIQSEQQRLHREAHVSIPYHKPKRHTLQEFLQRRTIMKPQLQENRSAVTVGTRPKNLKMTAEELEAYAKLMDERAKEAKEFFRSESDDEDDSTLKDHENSSDDLPTNVVGTDHKTANKTEISTEDINQDQAKDIEYGNINEEQSAAFSEPQQCEKSLTSDKQDMFPLHKEINYNLDQSSHEKIKIPGNAVITEVVELPNLNLKEMKITIDKIEEKPKTPIVDLKRQIIEKCLNESPSLKGNADMLIDLESGNLVTRKASGVDNLFQRLLATRKPRKQKTTQSIDILSTENGILEHSKVQLPIHEDIDPNVEHKPGACYIELKKNLKSILAKKRVQDIKKKQEEEKEYLKCLEGDDEDEYDEYDEYESNTKPSKKDIVIDEEENIDDTINEVGDEEMEVDENTKLSEGSQPKKDEYCDDGVVVSSEAEVTDDDNEDIDTDEHSSSSDDEQIQDAEISKRKNRILKAFQDDSGDEIDLLKTQSQEPITKLAVSLFDPEVCKNADEEENELVTLCSGQFDTQVCYEAITDPVPKTGCDKELQDLCSDHLESTMNKTQDPMTSAAKLGGIEVKNKILSSDEEKNGTHLSVPTNRIKKLSKRMKKKRVKLGFSDDEENSDSEYDETELAESDTKENVHKDENLEKEQVETFIDYDSEENEIIVKVTEKERLMQAQDFLEKEADLSESDWGSADEDENNLDKYDIELGDEDEFDQEKLRMEIGQIHARKMLDEDIKEVRKIQEQLFEDEETDGVGRQRQFRWKNAETGFSLEDPNGENDADKAASGDEENEQLWRKIRFEREQILKEQDLKKNSQEYLFSATTLSTTAITGKSNTPTTTSSIKKFSIIKGKQSNVEERKNSPFLISKLTAVGSKKPARGSFLIRDKDTLVKLAGLTKSNGGLNDADGTAGTVSVKSITPKNFVFATLTEEEHETLKRKAGDMMNSSSGNGINYMKKPKVEPRRGQCLIDKLLQ